MLRKVVESKSLYRSFCFLSLSLMSCMCTNASAQPRLIQLSSKNFEGVTQASTGQTTGVWFVLFTSSVEPSLQPLSEAWAQLGEEQSGEPILHGLVDTAEDPHLTDRFKISGVPTFLLFRDRKMYKYSGVDTGADALGHFSRQGYKSSEPLLVPPEPSPIEAALDALKSNSKLAIAGATLAFLAVTSALLLRQGKPAIDKAKREKTTKEVKAQ
ncbi:hypothetical protein COCSUDRAFT_53219 [Coccomyxa subellipsoidea C-169]|uniref:Thioredoxin domain-containing protein n=1 Tax=Coccomyxa subellipsoidea (strain C-169) TaxID=574566 RepID=I0Z0B9_COCSC|nr:hypothetical protein COCSUDRAFT_53219 [Coccomyxa subellipsoidea C-169]EIE24088.1 hypothetical protein COCSUDRAFT_53219 [Coccomyxa subellipsoidea C-169]|eukprot:XP_005648632.1 hypothetical protein COCSUDRAFT_53219 [Coccomyxa subellipsoidea C-169]